MKDLKVGDILLTDAGDGVRFLRGVISVDEFGARTWTMQLSADGSVYSIHPGEVYYDHAEMHGWEVTKIASVAPKAEAVSEAA